MQVPADKTVYPFSSAQSMLLWGEIFSIEPQKVKEENIISFYFQVAHQCDFMALEKTYNKIIEINDALRLKIFGHKLKFKQYIKDFCYEKLEVLTLQGENELQQYLKTIYNNKINWTDDNLVWAKVLDCGAGNGVLVFRCHHACMDGYSMGLLYEQIDKCYSSYASGQEPLFAKQYSITEYFNYQEKYAASKQHDRDKEFWKQAYNHQPNYSFPAGKRALKGDASSASLSITSPLYEGILNLAQDIGCSVQGLLMSLAAVTVYVLTNAENFAIYSLTHGRRNIKLRQTVGCMQNTVPIFYHVLPEDTVVQWIRNNYINYLETLSHGSLPMGEQIPLSYKEPILHRFNFNHGWLLFSSMDYENASRQSVYHFGTINLPYLAHQFYCAMLEVAEEKIDIMLDYQNRKFTRDQIEKILQTFNKIAMLVIGNGEITIKQIKAQIENSF